MNISIHIHRSRRMRDANFVVWKMQVGNSAPIRGGLIRSPGWVIGQYFSEEEDARAWIAKQMRPNRYRITNGPAPSE